jgi:dihydroorotate dehydrogenase (fumarate)
VSADLCTRYLGLELSSPVVASASPLNEHVDSVRAAVDAGAAAIVMPSLFEEEVVHEQVGLHDALEAGSDHVGEALDYFPEFPDLLTVADRYVRSIEALKAAVDVPVIASLNAAHAGAWEEYATRLVDAGADAIELNLYSVAADPRRSGAEVEAEKLAAIAMVRAAVEVPVAVKVSPYFSSFAHFAHQAVDAGADGLVVFNRFYQPDIDLDTMEVVPRVDLSSSVELRVPIRWIAILRPLLPAVSLAATSGIGSGWDAAKALAVGADVTMVTSAVLREGPSAISRIVGGLQHWLDDHEYESVGQLRGSMSYAATDDPSAFERANYRRVLHAWSGPMP